MEVKLASMAPGDETEGSKKASGDPIQQGRKALVNIEKAVDQVRNALMNAFKVKVSKNTKAYVFPPEDQWKGELGKDAVTGILNTLSKIIVYVENTDDVLIAMDEMHSASCRKIADTIINEVKKHGISNQTTQHVSFADKVKRSSEGLQNNGKAHTLVIKTKEASAVFGEIKKKINLREKKIKFSKAPYIKDKSTMVLNFTEEDDLNRMKTEIENLNIPETKIIHSKKLNPTVRIFDVGQTEDSQLIETIEDITGSKPILISGSVSQVTKKKNVIVRLTKEQFYALNEKSPGRILIEYNSFRYEKFISVRFCRNCKCIGHSSNYCRLDDKYKHVVDKCVETKTCTTCVLKELDSILISEPKINKALELVFKKITHGVFSNTCTEYLKQLNMLEKLYDF